MRWLGGSILSFGRQGTEDGEKNDQKPSKHRDHAICLANSFMPRIISERSPERRYFGHRHREQAVPVPIDENCSLSDYCACTPLVQPVADRAELDRLIAGDPFAQEGLIAKITIVAWDPLFGAFTAESSGSVK
jgi:hypothetical protein